MERGPPLSPARVPRRPGASRRRHRHVDPPRSRARALTPSPADLGAPLSRQLRMIHFFFPWGAAPPTPPGLGGPRCVPAVSLPGSGSAPHPPRHGDALGKCQGCSCPAPGSLPPAQACSAGRRPAPRAGRRRAPACPRAGRPPRGGAEGPLCSAAGSAPPPPPWHRGRPPGGAGGFAPLPTGGEMSPPLPQGEGGYGGAGENEAIYTYSPRRKGGRSAPPGGWSGASRRRARSSPPGPAPPPPRSSPGSRCPPARRRTSRTAAAWGGAAPA